MFQSEMISSMNRGLQTSENRSLALRPGQMFQGMITKLYPGQTAQLQAGNMTLTAQLEAQLETGRQYWFRVQAGDGMPRLQVMEQVRSNPQGDQQQSQRSQILQQLGLQTGGPHEQLLRHFQQTSQPFTQTDLASGARLLQQSGLPAHHSLQLISRLVNEQLPLTRETFQALAALQHPQSMGETMHALHESLAQSSSSGNESRGLQQILGSLLQQTNSSKQIEPVRQLFNALLTGENSVRTQAEQVLRETGIMRAKESAEQFFSRIQAEAVKPENRAPMQQAFPQLFQGQSGNQVFNAMKPANVFTMLMNAAGPDQPEGLTQMLRLINPDTAPQQVFEQLDRLMQQRNHSASPLLQMIHEQQADRELLFLQRGQGQDTAQLRMFLQQLGLQHEHDLRIGLNDLQQSREAGQRIETLKGQLLHFLQNQANQTPQTIQQAEFLLQRLTGFQIASQEQQHPVQHLLFQVPFKFGEQYSDITMQWEGKRTKEGYLDEDHCRIMFYLELAAIRDTMVDVQIQNRVVSLTIFNQMEKPEQLQRMFEPILAKRLEETGYKLSSVRWKQPDNTPAKDKNNPDAQTEKRKRQNYKGVDVRI
ncbi:hypothetical protein [Salisediminibacterium halotolerans]|uniref:hypothetical protein n=1 Tax=Salisediminibacterium halotolerans TaxID=517425 RepID=UPI000EB48CB9|nr:hypothetical protein [Salisediminibacterium halotolerans]RLJ74239.1 hypothetical protein BCL39_1527 [Actinophytocola xinjiangensis]RPE87669.1 hypothetical protein EDD67_1405 [Salisediminibacterium halotolerans]TWG35076.1 hypothetical protein BCL52_1524 [Salisediminibacterium halotolerans]GEL06876.1 hypothetical protein SHA02_02920 [Salisediminibacterium halotolerans]